MVEEVTEMVDLLGMTREELEDFVQSLGERPFRGRQIMRWIYHHGVKDFDSMSDLPRPFRRQLAEHALIHYPRVIAEEVSRDGTRKFLLELQDGHCIETVLIPDEDRLTLCLSTQVGCSMGCRFCVTATQGFARDLKSSEIVGQVMAVRERLPSKVRITNLVFMGMGEPLANYEQVVKAIRILQDDLGLNFSARRVTLSTVGLLPELERLLSEGVRCRLAISLNASDQETRARLMPISKKYPLEELLELCRRLPLPSRERITFEYVLIEGLNASRQDALRLAELLRGIRCKVNLIPLNEAPELPFRAPRPEKVLKFQEVLLQRGYTVLVRESRGADISAACGQLKGRLLRHPSPSGRS